jgi:uncharacterized protein
MKHKSCLAEFKALDQSQGVFEALVSVFDVVDLVNDRVAKGAFTNSLKKWESSGAPIPVIWSHMWDDPDAHVGKTLEAREIDRGLYVKGQLDMEDPFAAKVFKLLQERRVKEFSFAYDVVDERRTKEGVNELLELDLIEVGPTLKGMNLETQLLGTKGIAIFKQSAGEWQPATKSEVTRAELEELLKSFSAELKGALGASSGPTSVVDQAWDGPANEARLSTDAGAETYRQAHAWVDPDGDPDVKSSYKFIHHEVSGEGRVGAANVRGCIAGVAVLNGGRGGANIPDSDRKGVYNHLAAHIRAADMEPPPLKSRDDFKAKAGRVLSAKNEGDIKQARDLLDGVLKQLQSEKPEEEPKAVPREPTRAIGTRSDEPLRLLIELEAMAS